MSLISSFAQLERLSLTAILALAMTTLATASALPVQSEFAVETTFSCPSTHSVSLCCANDIRSNGAVQGCQYSTRTSLEARNRIERFFKPATEICTIQQITSGYQGPTCCKSSFKPQTGDSVSNGLNCVPAVLISARTSHHHKRNSRAQLEKPSKTLEINHRTVTATVTPIPMPLTKRTMAEIKPSTVKQTFPVRELPDCDEDSTTFCRLQLPRGQGYRLVADKSQLAALKHGKAVELDREEESLNLEDVAEGLSGRNTARLAAAERKLKARVDRSIRLMSLGQQVPIQEEARAMRSGYLESLRKAAASHMPWIEPDEDD